MTRNTVNVTMNFRGKGRKSQNLVFDLFVQRKGGKGRGGEGGWRKGGEDGRDQREIRKGINYSTIYENITHIRENGNFI